MPLGLGGLALVQLPLGDDSSDSGDHDEQKLLHDILPRLTSGRAYQSARLRPKRPSGGKTSAASPRRPAPRRAV